MTKTAVTASAPAKVTLFGEHFVVDGEPAVALLLQKQRAKNFARAIEHAGGTAFMAQKTDEGVKVESEC